MQTHHTSDTETGVTRRRFFAWVGWGSFAAFWVSVTLATMRFLFPRILYEPSQVFRAGKPNDYRVGEISTRFKKDQRVWIVRTSEGIYALIPICTHLGCTPIWHGNEERIKCPCHGSVFLRNGDNIAGPAPVPLYRAAVMLDLGGQLVVDKARQENRSGERDRPPFFLPLLADGKPMA